MRSVRRRARGARRLARGRAALRHRARAKSRPSASSAHLVSTSTPTIIISSRARARSLSHTHTHACTSRVRVGLKTTCAESTTQLVSQARFQCERLQHITAGTGITAHARAHTSAQGNTNARNRTMYLHTVPNLCRSYHRPNRVVGQRCLLWRDQGC